MYNSDMEFKSNHIVQSKNLFGKKIHGCRALTKHDVTFFVDNYNRDRSFFSAEG